MEFSLFTSNLKDIGVTVLIAPFLTKPDIIIWGSRYFMWNGVVDQYVEAFAVCPMKVTAKDTGEELPL